MTDNGPQIIYGGVFRQAWRRSLGSISLVIVWGCVALFLGVTVLDLIGVVSRRDAVSVLGLSYTGLVQRKYVFELVTAPLLHANVAHLVFNMLSLWMLGPDVEQRLGRLRYVTFSVLCSAAGMIGFLLFNGHSSQVVVGYSGVIFGLLVAQAIYFPNSVVAVFAFFPVKMKYAVLLLGVVELYLMVAPEDAGVSHVTHIFGAIVAFVYLRVNMWHDSMTEGRGRPSELGITRKLRQIKRRAEVPTEL